MASCVVILLSCGGATATTAVEHMLSCVLVLLLLVFCTRYEMWRREGPDFVLSPLSRRHATNAGPTCVRQPH